MESADKLTKVVAIADNEIECDDFQTVNNRPKIEIMEPASSEESPQKVARKCCKMLKEDCSRKTACIVVTAVLIPVSILLLCVIFNAAIIGVLEEYGKWHTKNEILGFLIYILLFMALIIIMFPPMQMIILGAFMWSQIYGKLTGSIMIFCISMIVYPLASLISFFIGKNCLKSFIQKNLVQKVRVFRAIEKAIVVQGLKMTILARLQTGIPWIALNYLLSVTDCSMRLFYLGTLIGMIPKLVQWIIIGVNLQAITNLISGEGENDSVTIVFLCFSLTASLIVVFLISRESKKQINRIL